MAVVDDTSAGEIPAHRPTRANWTASFDALCRWLSSEPTSLAGQEMDWVALIEHANRERVVTNLYSAFQKHGWPPDAPDDLREYLGLVYEANAAKNRAVRRQALDIAGAFAGAGVRYAFLKGANWLLEADDRDIGQRWLSDIDLVIASDDRTKALATLANTGFAPLADPLHFANHFHYVPFIRPDDQVMVEVHRHLGWQRYILSPDEVVGSAQPLAGAPQARLSSPAHRFVFGCMHAQLQNMEYAAGHFSLRDLCDIQNLAATEPGKLNWAEIAELSRERGIYRYLAASLHLCHRLLGLSLPAPFADSSPARRHAERCLARHRSRFGLRANGLAVKIAWLLDERRHAYELDCERAPWTTRQIKIARGRASSVLAALMRRKRLAD